MALWKTRVGIHYCCLKWEISYYPGLWSRGFISSLKFRSCVYCLGFDLYSLFFLEFLVLSDVYQVSLFLLCSEYVFC